MSRKQTSPARLHSLAVRLTLLTWAAASVATPAAAAAERGKSEWVSVGPGGKLVYKTTPAGDRIMDFSHAGYRGGGVALPDVPVRQTVAPTGGGGGGGADDTAVIQAAVDAVAAMPPDAQGFRGAVLLAPGTFTCVETLRIPADGVVLRGSGSTGDRRSTIKLVGQPHLGIAVRGARSDSDRNDQKGASTRAAITDAYVPSGAISFTVADASGFAPGDAVEVRRPVTEAWVRFMGMHDLVRNGQPQTWIKVGNRTVAERLVAKVTGNTITLDAPLSDSFDARYLNPPGAAVVKVTFPRPGRLARCGVESLHVECPPQPISHEEPHFTALRISGEDCWARDLVIDETMNSVGVSGRRITLQRVTVNRKANHVGSSKPAEFAPNATQTLMDRCAVNGNNVWFSGTGAGVAGPIVVLNCTFAGESSRAESHQRWSTGLLFDNVRAETGGLDFRNRGAMGSGHGWSMGWGAMWNCRAKEYVVQQPPGVMNWMIGCVGEVVPKPRPFDKAPDLPDGTLDSHGTPVAPQSLYLTQLAERLGPQALKNLGY